MKKFTLILVGVSPIFRKALVRVGGVSRASLDFTYRPFLLFLPLQLRGGCRCHGKKFTLASWPLFTVVLQEHLPFAPCVPKWSGRIIQSYAMAVREQGGGIIRGLKGRLPEGEEVEEADRCGSIVLWGDPCAPFAFPRPLLRPPLSLLSLSLSAPRSARGVLWFKIGAANSWNRQQRDWRFAECARSAMTDCRVKLSYGFVERVEQRDRAFMTPIASCTRRKKIEQTFAHSAAYLRKADFDIRKDLVHVRERERERPKWNIRKFFTSLYYIIKKNKKKTRKSNIKSRNVTLNVNLLNMHLKYW